MGQSVAVVIPCYRVRSQIAPLISRSGRRFTGSSNMAIHRFLKKRASGNQVMVRKAEYVEDATLR